MEIGDPVKTSREPFEDATVAASHLDQAYRPIPEERQQRGDMIRDDCMVAKEQILKAVRKAFVEFRRSGG